MLRRSVKEVIRRDEERKLRREKGSIRSIGVKRGEARPALSRLEERED